MLSRSGIIFLLFALILSGCAATGKPMVWKEKNVSFDTYRTFEIQPVVNETGKDFKQDIASLLTTQLKEQFREKGLPTTDTSGESNGVLMVQSVLLTYEPGNAFKRWLAPGAGKTQCTLRARLVDKQNNKTVAEIVAAKEVGAGGLYSAGADTWILKEVAAEIAQEVAKMMPPRTSR